MRILTAFQIFRFYENIFSRQYICRAFSAYESPTILGKTEENLPQNIILFCFLFLKEAELESVFIRRADIHFKHCGKDYCTCIVVHARNCFKQ